MERLLLLLPLNYATVGRIASLNKHFQREITSAYWFNRLRSLNRPLKLVERRGEAVYPNTERDPKTYFFRIGPSYYKRGPAKSWCYKYTSTSYSYEGRAHRLYPTGEGKAHRLYLTGEGIMAIGNNNSGQCGGDPSYFANNFISGHFIDVTIGGRFSLILKADGKVYSFGWNKFGQLGRVTEKEHDGVPTPLPNLPVISLVFAGRNHSVLLSRDGRVFTFGKNDYGQLGDNSLTDRITPIEIKFSRPVADIRTAENTTVFVLDNGDEYITGYQPYYTRISTEPQLIVRPHERTTAS